MRIAELLEDEATGERRHRDSTRCVEELRQADKLLLTTHENPDGDALGSLLGDALDPRAARQGLADVHVAGRVPAALRVPRHGPSTSLVGAPPDDLDERTVVFLDCGNIDRMPVDFLQRDGHPHPQHRPPPRQHPLRHGEPRGARGVVHGRDRLASSPRSWAPRSRPQIADALYVGLVTDTGRFMYENTTPAAHRMAADLIEAGVDAARGLPAPLRGPALPPPQLLQRALAERGALRRRRDHGRAPRCKADFEETGALETDSEGIVDHLRAVEGTQGGGARARAAGRRPRRPAQGEPARHRRHAWTCRGSRARSAAAGTARPPGFSTELAATAELVEQVCASRSREQLARLTARRQPGSSCFAKPAGVTSHDVVAARAPRAAARGRRSGHAGTLDPFATGLLLVLVGRATRAQRFLWACRRPTAPSRGWAGRSDTGDRDGELEQTGRVPERLEHPDRRAACSARPPTRP